ncbi:molybdopterin-binding protein [Caldisericum sp. AR60]|uniref:molybdopterin-binding protein n=1 Tax=Caldisericum sp. AR60 TaxID=3397852 RepID=UPI0039FD0E74
MIKKVKIEDAVGLPLGADVTQIIPQKYKGPLFRTGHVISKKDLDMLRMIGKEYVWIYEKQEGFIHQDEASLRIANSLIDESLYVSGPSEGWAIIKAKESGIFLGDDKIAKKINGFNRTILTTIENYSLVSENQQVAKCKITSIETNERLLDKIESIGKDLKKDNKSALRVVKPMIKRFGVIVTGSEVYYGLVEDAATEKVIEKLKSYGAQVVFNKIVRDDKTEIKKAIDEAIQRKVEAIILTGGMGPDPDDATASSIKEAGGKILRYGVPVNPASMSLIASIGDIPLLGISAGFISFKKSFLDFILPRILVKEKITKREIASWGLGGILRQD